VAGADELAILDGLEEAVVAVDAAGKLTYANAAAATLLGADPLTDLELWAHTQERNPWLTEAIDLALHGARSHARHQVRLEVHDGHRTIGLRVTPLFADVGGLRGAACLLFDESSLESLSENVRRFDRLQEVNILASGLAHEIKNPLGGILGAAQLLRGETLTTEAKECVDVIERDVRRINRLIEGLLDFGKPKPLHRKSVNLHRLLDDVLVGLEHDVIVGGHPLVRDYDPSLPDLMVDADGIHQVALNLIKNAFEAAAPGSLVAVRTRVDLAGRRVSKRAVLVEVQNEGEAIPDDVRRRLFTPFFTTKGRGSGLGLLVSLRIAREHGGTIEVASERGKTVFTLVLPMEFEE
jgi:two-component system nitrogen regulation sensor histidine kinase GlnL